MFWETSSLGLPDVPRSLLPNGSRLNLTFPSWVQLFTHSPASFLLSSPLQLRDQAGSAHDMATMAVSRGKAVLSDAESLLASLEGKRHQSEHLQPQPGSHQVTRRDLDRLVMVRLLL